MADIKNFGIKGIASDVQLGKSGGRLKYDSSNGRFDLTQSDGSTLEDLRLGSVTSGAWTATAVATQYGGTGVDLSSSTGIVQVNNGVGSAGNIDLSDADFINTNTSLAVAQGGTGATTAAGARSALGLGSIATQGANNITITGGTLNNTVIGGSTAAAITGTTITANSGFVGDLTGTADDANGLSSAVTVGLSGDATGSQTFQNAGDTATIAMTLASTGVSAGTQGSASEVPVITVDAKGRITALSTASISTGFTLSGDIGSDDAVAGGETITFEGSSNQIETTISDNKVEIGIVDGAQIANLTVSGTFTSDDITSSTVSVDGDAVITGNLTVQGTQTTVNSTTVETGDPIFRVNSNGTTGTDVGFEANVGGNFKQIVYTGASNKWSVGSETFVAATFEGDLTGDVTGDVTGDLTGDVYSSGGQKILESGTNGSDAVFTGDVTGDVTGTVSSLSNLDTDDLGEGSSNLYYTVARANAAIDARVTGGTGLSASSGEVSLDNTAVTPGSYGNATTIPNFTVDQQGRLTAAGETALQTSWLLTADSGSQAIDGGDTVDVEGGTNITTSVSATDKLTIDLDATPSVTGLVASGTITGGTLTDGAFSASSGAITGATNITASGAVTGGSLTDGVATLSSGALSGATTGAFSSNVSATNFIASAGLESATLDVSGLITFGSLTDGAITITGFVDEDDFNSDSSQLIPTQQSVKAYVDSQLSASSLQFAGDSGSGSIDLDSQTLTIQSSNSNLGVTVSGQAANIALNSTLTGLSSVTSTNFVGNLTGDVVGDLTGDVTGDVTGDLTGDVSGNVTGNVTGNLDGIVGGTTPAAVTGTTVTANSGFVGNLTGNIVGNVTGDVTGDVKASDNSVMVDSSAKTFTGDLTGDVTGNADTATALETARTITIDGDVDAAAVSFDGTQNITLTTTLDNTGVNAGNYGSTTQVPVLTIDAKGRVTSASVASVASTFDIAGDNGSNDTVNNGDTLTFEGETNQIETTISDNKVKVGIKDGAQIANLTVTGTFTSDDITSSTVNVDGDAVITGNLTVQGTQTVVESTTVAASDPILRVNSDGTTGTDVGFEANVGGVMKQIIYTGAGNKWSIGSETFQAGAIEITGVGQVLTGDVVGDVTGDLTGDVTGDIYASDGTSKVLEAGSDGSDATFTGDVTGDLTGDVTGNVSGNVTGNLTGDVYASNGTSKILEAGTNGSDATFTGDVTGDLVGDVTGDVIGDLTGDVTGTVSSIANHDTDALSEGSTNLYFTNARARSAISVSDAGGDGSLAYNSTTGVITYTGPSAAEVRAHFSGGTGVDITNGVVSIDQSVATTADVTFNNVTASANFIGDVTGNVSGTSATLSGTVSFGSLTDGNFTITDITDTVSDNDALLPTAGAIVDYISNNAAEGLLLRNSFSANSSDNTFDIGTMPNNTARTYYANKLVLKVSTAFSGGSVNAIKITENGAAGSTVVAVDDADVTTIGTYVVELDGDIALTKNAPIRVSFVQSDGNTAATPSTGAMVASIHYNFV